MKKIIVIAVAVVCFITSSGIILYATSSNDFATTLEIDPTHITKIRVKVPHGNTYKSTTDKDKINLLIQYFSEHSYSRVMNDEPGYMPMRASTIYLYEEDKMDFIIPYGSEVMINQKVYHVRHGKLENTIINEFYDALD
ncbi:hypothetical protein WMZ97_05405 [Lentibacillus sp. N15]|uniref:hypothetical protein n=1 Tax=Lentibacillus songyuanensis TaxID=3136161 RepID=UPI0031BA9671